MIGHRLRKLREEHHLTQKALAAMLHISPATYRSYENGSRTPSLETLFACAELYQISLDYLYGRIDFPDFFPLKSVEEALLLQRYRRADEQGRDTIRYFALYEFSHHNLIKAQKRLNRKPGR